MCIYTILITVFNYFNFQYKNDDTKTHLLFLNQYLRVLVSILQFIMYIYIILITAFNYFNFQCKNDNIKIQLLFLN